MGCQAKCSVDFTPVLIYWSQNDFCSARAATDAVCLQQAPETAGSGGSHSGVAGCLQTWGFLLPEDLDPPHFFVHFFFNPSSMSWSTIIVVIPVWRVMISCHVRSVTPICVCDYCRLLSQKYTFFDYFFSPSGSAWSCSKQMELKDIKVQIQEDTRQVQVTMMSNGHGSNNQILILFQSRQSNPEFWGTSASCRNLDVIPGCLVLTNC